MSPVTSDLPVTRRLGPHSPALRSLRVILPSLSRNHLHVWALISRWLVCWGLYYHVVVRCCLVVLIACPPVLRKKYISVVLVVLVSWQAFSVRRSLNHVLEDQIPPPLRFDRYIELYPCKSEPTEDELPDVLGWYFHDTINATSVVPCLPWQSPRRWLP